MKRKIMVFGLIAISLLIIGCEVKRSSSFSDNLVVKTSEVKEDEDDSIFRDKNVTKKEKESSSNQSKVKEHASKEVNNSKEKKQDIQEEVIQEVKINENVKISTPVTSSKEETTINSSNTSTKEVQNIQPNTVVETKSNIPSVGETKPQTNEDLINQLEGNKQEETICIAATSGYVSEEQAYAAALQEIAQYESSHEGSSGSCGVQQHFDDFGHSYWTYWVTYN